MKTKATKRKEALERLRNSTWSNSKARREAVKAAAQGRTVDMAKVEAAWHERKANAIEKLETLL